MRFVHLSVDAVDPPLAILEPRARDESKGDGLPRISDALVVLIFIIFAPIAGAEIADSQEREIVVVGDVIEEGRRPARLEDAVAWAGPEIGADAVFVGSAMQHDHLRAVAVLACLPLAAVLQFVEGNRGRSEERMVGKE